MSERDAVPSEWNAFNGISCAVGATRWIMPITIMPWPNAAYLLGLTLPLHGGRGDPAGSPIGLLCAMSVGDIGVRTTLCKSPRLSSWFTSASTKPVSPPTVPPKRLMKVVGSRGVVTRKTWPNVPSSDPTMVHGDSGRLQKTCSAESPPVVRMMIPVSAFAGVAHSKARSTPASQTRPFMAVVSLLPAAFLLSRLPASPHLFPKYLAQLAPENHARAWISPPKFIHTPRNKPSAIRGLQDGGISTFPI